jgi:hypothetical protein
MTTAQPTNAQLARLNYCRRYGHGWPLLRDANPGDEHWCDYCGSCRIIGPDGTIAYIREWE